jgi:serine/threonine protein kinase/DNA-directed RNA polymerase subunit RPC12/RpoP
MIHFRCPRCGVRLKGNTRSAGRKRTCPKCGEKVVVPSNTVTSPPELWNPDGSDPRRDEFAKVTDSTRPESNGSSLFIPATSDVTHEDCSFLGRPQSEGELGRLGAFRVMEVLGAGATGIVFRAEDAQLRRQVALKVLRPTIAASTHARRRFLREARAAAAFEHDHIVTIYQVGEDGGIPWLAMKLLRGESLKDRLSGPNLCLPTDQAMRIGAEVADALSVAHSGGLVHRDIKPSNILLEQGSDRTKLIDFGLVLLDDEEGQLTKTGCVVGTPSYMAPEQADGAAVDHRSDLYGLGCVLYRSTTGRVPFEGQTYLQVFLAQRMEEAVHPQKIDPLLPADFSDLIMKLLAKEPSDRPQSAGVVRDALRAMRAGRADSPPHQPAGAEKQRTLASVGEPAAPAHSPGDATLDEPAITETLSPLAPSSVAEGPSDARSDELPVSPDDSLVATAEAPALATAATVESPIVSPGALAAANPWADVVVEPSETPSIGLDGTSGEMSARRRRELQLRRLVWIAVGSVGLLILAILLAMR